MEGFNGEPKGTPTILVSPLKKTSFPFEDPYPNGSEVDMSKLGFASLGLRLGKNDLHLGTPPIQRLKGHVKIISKSRACLGKAFGGGICTTVSEWGVQIAIRTPVGVRLNGG